jgi:putative transposase
MLEKVLKEVFIDVAMTIFDRAVSIDMPECKFCHSKAVVKNGKRSGTQYYLCKECGRGFVYNKALPRMKYPKEVVARGVYDYYAGKSLSKIRGGIKQQYNLEPSDSTIYGWVKRLTKTGIKEADNYIPQVGNKWVADETVIKLKDGKKYWLINVIDAGTRFILVSKLSKTCNIQDMISVFIDAQKKAGGAIPKVILTDGWKAYIEGIEQVFGADTKHIVSTPFTEKELSTNVVERWHGTLKDRLKPMRGMDKSDTQQLILKGFIFYYNFLRPHESLNGKTPAEAAKIKYPYKNWEDIIHSEEPKPRPIRTVSITTSKPYRKRKPKTRKLKSYRNVSTGIKQVRL